MTPSSPHARPEVDALRRAARRCAPAALSLPAAASGLAAAVLVGVVSTWWAGLLIGLAAAAAVMVVGIRVGRSRAVERVVDAVGARSLGANEYPRFRNLIEGLSATSGVPEPTLFVVEGAGANLMVAGTPTQSAIVATTELLERLNRVELEAVLAEGLCLIRDHVADVGTQAAVFAAGRLLSRGPAGGEPSSWEVSRARTLVAALGSVRDPAQGFRADLEAVRLTRYPPALARAFEKMAEVGTVVPSCPWGVAHLWICDPLVAADPQSTAGRLNERFAHEPPLRHRIDLLAEL
jgi:heat shock protein HtpX